MKKLNALLLSLVAMGSTFVSCTTDNDGEDSVTKTNIILTGKYNFSNPNGWGLIDTQCSETPDYINFVDATHIEYGDYDTQNTSDCTLIKFDFPYSTTPSAVTFTGLNGAGSDLTFDVIKNTSSELQLRTEINGQARTYILTKAQQ